VTNDDFVLVGDVGGTHARFAIVDVSRPSPWRIEQRLDLEDSFPTFNEALRSYLERSGVQAIPTEAVLAVAGPVTAGRVQFSNRQWAISEQALQDFGFKYSLLINDFAAVARGIEALSEADVRFIGPALTGSAGEPISILGAGTGFGVSYLVRAGDRPVAVATEGGHMSFGPYDDEEVEVLRYLRKHFGRVSIERILSGSGLELLYQALESIGGRQAVALSAAEISSRATSGDAGCGGALTMFCAIFGSVAGDFALAQGARGGVYIAGGIAPKIEQFLCQSAFRTRFEDKGRMSIYVRSIPTKLILNADAALLGAALASRHHVLRDQRGRTATNRLRPLR
jgi:glucokinase